MNDKSANRRVVGGDDQPAPRTAASDKLDEGNGVAPHNQSVRARTRLRVAIDDGRIGDGWQIRGGRNRLHAGARNVEADRIGVGAGRCPAHLDLFRCSQCGDRQGPVVDENCLAQRQEIVPKVAVDRRVDRDNRSQQLAILKSFKLQRVLLTTFGTAGFEFHDRNLETRKDGTNGESIRRRTGLAFRSVTAQENHLRQEKSPSGRFFLNQLNQAADGLNRVRKPEMFPRNAKGNSLFFQDLADAFAIGAQLQYGTGW